ncbi:hypothetical protein HDU87_001605 [Geranomyces variabilis]|uniref:5'-nucleotidase n=1 Tax=Geranomyces variabilis TaxID=109894 RepID=A0AAD5TPM8_9FUNG|nr:hypothetical protein HDU87_001605 [Geranomyces variabilis]
MKCTALLTLALFAVSAQAAPHKCHVKPASSVAPAATETGDVAPPTYPTGTAGVPPTYPTGTAEVPPTYPTGTAEVPPTYPTGTAQVPPTYPTGTAAAPPTYPTGVPPTYPSGTPGSSTTSSSLPSGTPLPPPKKNAMTILATNDIHAHLDEFNSGGTDCKQKDIDANNCVGGAARIQYMVNKFRAQSENVVLLDAGDQFQGTLFFNVFGGSVSATLMNQMKYDAMTIGNHEFDKGVEYAASFFKNLTFPVVSSNIDFTGPAKPLAASVKPYTILKDYGVGIIGYITNTTAAIATGASDVTFYNPVQKVQTYVDELHAQGIKRVICLSHNGYQEDKYVAENVRGVSAFVGGHSHSLLLNNASIAGVEGPYPTEVKDLDGKTSYIIQSHRYGDYLGHLDLEWNTDNELTHVFGESIRLDKSIPKDNATAAQVAEWRKAFAGLTAKIVGHTGGNFDQTACGTGQECALGDLVADAMRLDTRADICFTNTGGLRASIEGGDVTYADVLTVLPFGNVDVDFTYTGQQIIDLLERVYAGHNKITNAPVISLPQWSGIKFTFDPTKPEFSRISNVVVGSAPIVLTKSYTLCTNDFVSAGGDGIMDKIAAAPGNLMADALIAYFEAKGTVNPTLDGRITKA